MQLVSSGNEFISAGMDDTLKVTDISSKNVAIISTSALPRGISTSDDKTIVVATENEIQVIQGGKKVDSLVVGYNATSVAINQQGTIVAIGAQVCYFFSFPGIQNCYPCTTTFLIKIYDTEPKSLTQNRIPRCT